MGQNKYITLTGIPNHEQNNCGQNTPRCFCHDEAKMVYSEKDKSGHYVYAQKVLRPPEWARGYKGQVSGVWQKSAAFAQWLKFRMEEFEAELEHDYLTPTIEDVRDYADADGGRERAETQIISEFRW